MSTKIRKFILKYKKIIGELPMKNSNEKHFCPICGEPTARIFGNYNKYNLCPEHSTQEKTGEIEQCPECGKWNKKGIVCDCKNNKKKQKETQQTEKGNFANKCIVCGKETDGYLFCKSHYYEYKDKDLLIKIHKCTEIEILDNTYEGTFTCKDGHIVKSKSEREIDNYLFEKGITHAYEKALPIDNDEKHDLHPDFLLKNFDGEGKDVYLEHWGYNENNINYTQTKKYKINKYKELGVTLICTNEKDMKDPEISLDRKLRFHEPNKINFDD
ncbi:MAG: hypothetical protein SPL13_05940 [Clostridia bacterium]|nr:hypothetical protein [Clostridia bacterium]